MMLTEKNIYTKAEAQMGDNIRIDFKEMDVNKINWIYLPQD